MQACCGTALAVRNYARAGLIHWREVRSGVLVTLVFAALGDLKTLARIPELWLLAVVMINLQLGQLSRAALPLMRESGDGGAIVLLSSIGGLVGSAQNAAYATAKAGLLGLNRSIAIDNGPHGIRCNAIAPGLCHSKLTERMFGAFSQISGLTSEEVQSRLTKPLPLGRIAQPEEIAGIIAFLASNEASFITGTVLAADGGATAVEVSLANIF